MSNASSILIVVVVKKEKIIKIKIWKSKYCICFFCFNSIKYVCFSCTEEDKIKNLHVMELVPIFSKSSKIRKQEIFCIKISLFASWCFACLWVCWLYKKIISLDY